jgi:hypothetical protein
MFTRGLLSCLDDLLRGNATRIDALSAGRVAVSIRHLFILNVLLGAFTGSCVGWFALVNRPSEGVWQFMASSVKVPLLFLLTFLVTLPSLYVFNALVGVAPQRRRRDTHPSGDSGHRQRRPGFFRAHPGFLLPDYGKLRFHGYFQRPALWPCGSLRLGLLAPHLASADMDSGPRIPSVSFPASRNPGRRAASIV